MRHAFIGALLLISGNALADSTELTAAIENTRTACSGISSELNHLKTMAGINTAVTGVGTVAGGVALGTGIAKSNIDKEIEKLNEELAKIEDDYDAFLYPIDIKIDESDGVVPDDVIEVTNDDIDDVSDKSATVNQRKEELKQQIAQKTTTSKNLGNVRTGTLATATATNIAGAVIAGNNRVKGDLQSQINECIASVKTLNNVRMQAYIDNTASPEQLDHAEQIEKNCGAWENVNITSINKKSTGATISSSMGAAMGLTGTITSISANSDKIRNDNTESGKQKEKNLNTASNVLAGGTTVASGVATIFNATQINAIKSAVNTAAKCEEVLQ